MRKIFLLSAFTALFISCGTADNQQLTVIPYPNEVEIRTGTFKVTGAEFHYSAEFDEAARDIITCFAQQLSLVTGSECKTSEGKGSKGFIFIKDTTLPEEAYTLKVTRKSAVIKASSLRGVNYAIQTLRQMLPVEIFGKEKADIEWTLPCAEINDAPRFGYRGMHLDVSRHFFDVDVIKRYLDIMEVHKLNKFHWHLTDSEGWRVEIKKYPELTKENWYTQEEIREVIAYAAAKGIDIIPEIDFPGHTQSILDAYPEHGCKEVGEIWGVLCAGNEKTMLFLEDVLGEIAELFPYDYVHIGGDECSKEYWEKCPVCQTKVRELGLKDDDKYKAEHYLQSYVMERMTKFLAGKGKKTIGWDEILEGKAAEGATVMSWRGDVGGLEATRLGHDVIMAPNTYFYLDYYQSLDTDKEPQAIGGYLPIERCYSYEPYVEGMTEEEKAHILGVQANLWTEFIATSDHLEYMLLPRMAALSEVQWCQPENKSWGRFLDSAPVFCRMYDVMGYNYAKHIFTKSRDLDFDNIGSIAL